MWMEKLTSGVLRVLTPLGPRYLQPSFRERIYLLWIFRHFDALPPKVLSARQRRFLDRLCAGEFITMGRFDEAPVIGTLESRPQLEPSSGRRVNTAEDTVSGFADVR